MSNLRNGEVISAFKYPRKLSRTGKVSPNRDVSIYHEHDDEDEADSHDDEKGDQVVFQRKAEVWHEDHMPPGKKQARLLSGGLRAWDTQSESPG